jgi:hypothetical protein
MVFKMHQHIKRKITKQFSFYSPSHYIPSILNLPRSSLSFQFDDLPAKTALSPISTYKNMSFTSFHLLNVPLAINTSLIAPEDKAAAASPPNALFGSRSALSQSDSETKEAAFPRIFVSPSYSSSSSTPFHQKFILHSFIIKPLGYIPKGRWAKFQIRAFDLEGETSKGALLFFGGDNGGEGFVSRSFQLWLTPWGPMNVLEIKATEGIPGGEDGGDWEFAFDDLVVEILEEEKGEEEKMEVGLDRDEV